MVSLYRKYRLLFIGLGLVLLTCFAYSGVRYCDFIYFDDPVYLTENYNVKKGVTLEGVKWAFTSGYAANWHPVTWLSLMVGCELYGLDPAWHHLTNLLIHILNVLLLFLLFNKTTNDVYKSLCVAALFAVHPIHVESVAWVTERKDVLSGFFWISTLILYTWYTKEKTWKSYLVVIISFSLGLMSKPMLVLLPVVLLFFDYWPLSRLSFPKRPPGAFIEGKKTDIRTAVFEKIPLLFLSFGSAVVTILVQHHEGAVRSASEVPYGVRISNAFFSYVLYLKKLFWPADLAMLYPHPGEMKVLPAVLSVILLLAVSIIAVRFLKKYPYFFVGWFWYLISILPVIGFVSIGDIVMADRYAYLPFIGLYVLLVFTLGDMMKFDRLKKIKIPGMILLFFVLSLLTNIQAGYWKDSVTLFKHTLSVTDNNYVIQNNLGGAYWQEGKKEEALRHFKAALELKPDYAEAHNNLGSVLEKIGQEEDAIFHYKKAIAIHPDFPKAVYNLGVLYGKQGDMTTSVELLEKAIRLAPEFGEAHYNIALAYWLSNQVEKALQHYQEAVRIDPVKFPGAYVNIGRLLVTQGKVEEGRRYLEQALNANPQDAEACYYLGLLSLHQKKAEQAMAYFKKTLNIQPDHAGALKQLEQMNRQPDARKAPQ
jgi:tetratricopeptide (TPR) repeat protein